MLYSTWLCALNGVPPGNLSRDWVRRYVICFVNLYQLVTPVDLDRIEGDTQGCYLNHDRLCSAHCLWQQNPIQR